MKSSHPIIDQMLENDEFSKWLGISYKMDENDLPVLKLRVKKEMLNGFSIAHGGIAYALADSALAFSANSRGRVCVSIETSISHIIPVKEDDELTARTTEKSLKNKLGIYETSIFNQENELIALFKGTVFRKEKNWNNE